MKNPLKTKKTNTPDPIFCTYWWQISLKKEYQQNPNLPILTGYSKMKMQSEAIDPLDCLMSKINMLQKNAWIDKALKIDIFKKPRPATPPNKLTDRLIITLYEFSYEIPAHLISKLPYELKRFLDEFYKARNGVATEIKYLPKPDKTKSKDDLFILSKHNFKNVMELLTWCEKQINNGESKIMVEHFYNKYLTKLV